MATRTQRWLPDTCECSIIEQFDDTLLELPHTLNTYERKCKAHEALGDNEAFTVVTVENRLKNAVVNKIVESLHVEPHDVEWTFQSNRVLDVTVNPKQPSAETQVVALRESVAQLVAGQMVDASLLDDSPKRIDQAEKDAIATELAGAYKGAVVLR